MSSNVFPEGAKYKLGLSVETCTVAWPHRSALPRMVPVIVDRTNQHVWVKPNLLTPA